MPIQLNKPNKLANPSDSLARFETSVNQYTGLFEFKIMRNADNETLYGKKNFKTL